MALPVMKTPVYTLEIPSTGKSVKYRPFLVKEQKALLLAQQSEDQTVMVDTLRDLIKSCVLDEIDVTRLAIFDLEYIFTQVRAKSVGEYVELIFPCDVCEDPKAITQISIDITQLEVTKPSGHSNKIPLFGDVGVVMKYPSIDTILLLEQVRQGSVDAAFDVIVECIDYIYTTDEVFHAKESTREELTEFINNLTQEQFAKIEKFFDDMPKLQKEIKYDCPVCGLHHDKVLEGLESFF